MDRDELLHWRSVKTSSSLWYLEIQITCYCHSELTTLNTSKIPGKWALFLIKVPFIRLIKRDLSPIFFKKTLKTAISIIRIKLCLQQSFLLFFSVTVYLNDSTPHLQIYAIYNIFKTVICFAKWVTLKDNTEMPIYSFCLPNVIRAATLQLTREVKHF